jgi:hypothetical protein
MILRYTQFISEENTFLNNKENLFKYFKINIPSLDQGFCIFYGSTTEDKVANIQEHGFKNETRDKHTPQLTTQKDAIIKKLPNQVIIEFKIPANKIRTYLTPGEYDSGYVFHSIIDYLPAEYINKIEPI